MSIDYAEALRLIRKHMHPGDTLGMMFMRVAKALEEIPAVTDWEDVEQRSNVIPWCDPCQSNHWECNPDLDQQRGL
ncbi:hypothetical protein [Bradyrhizobium sp.]|uniref:hypothetical protein n=1 Tax=Bradyrhizobium sp. TaxID=376 RepID=UPI0025C4059E|nr:hypothetical protein [Bradyrhizobium sp.]